MICCCIDLDGFYVDGEFITREMGWSDAEAKRMGCFHYTHNKTYSQLSDKDKKTFQFVTRHITGLPFYPSKKETDVHTQDQLKEDIVHVWSKCKTPHAFTVAYKVGTQERDILQELRIPSFNLENIGCPKYDKLQHLFLSINCGCHNSNKVHCSMSECHTFMLWFNKV